MSVGTNLQDYIKEKFQTWKPPAPRVLARGKGDITLDWQLDEPFGFLGDQLLYRLEKNNKLPKWIVVYSGGKTTKRIDNLAPRYPHKFRLKVIVKATAVHLLADLALMYYGDETNVRDKIEKRNETLQTVNVKNGSKDDIDDGDTNDPGDIKSYADSSQNAEETRKKDFKKLYEAVKMLNALKQRVVDGGGDRHTRNNSSVEGQRWLESDWSAETWSNTETDGASATCFCMAVRCGYLKQVQTMLDERPELIGIRNPSNGYTPLATAVRKGDINTVRLLLSSGAEVDQPCCGDQTPLHCAILTGHSDIVELLLEKGADLQIRDCNGLRAEHYAVDSGSVEMVRYILRLGDVHVRDNNGWTPLFRALCQGAWTTIVEELVSRGSDIGAVDKAGLPLLSVAKLLKNRQGRSRDSVMRLVDSHYPREMALAHFTRLTKKIQHVHSLFKH